MIVYVDTNIYIDFLKDRNSETGRDLGVIAGDFFQQVREGKFTIILSDWVERELYNNVPRNHAKMLISSLEENIITVNETKQDKVRAKELDSDDTDDARHAVLADKADADYLVTQNTTDYKNVMHLVDVRKPTTII